jgi:hypothetical protein
VTQEELIADMIMDLPRSTAIIDFAELFFADLTGLYEEDLHIPGGMLLSAGFTGYDNEIGV